MTERLPAGSKSHVGVLEEQGRIHGGPGSLNLPGHATRGGSAPVQPSLHVCEGLQQHHRCHFLFTDLTDKPFEIWLKSQHNATG